MNIIKFLKPKKTYHLKDYKFSLVFSVLVASILGIMVIGSANENFQSKQIFGLIMSIAIMITVSLIDYVWITNFYWMIYGLAIFLLTIVLIPGIGQVVNGARRWINLGFMTFQPSELAKILLKTRA